MVKEVITGLFMSVSLFLYSKDFYDKTLSISNNTGRNSAGERKKKSFKNLRKVAPVYPT